MLGELRHHWAPEAFVVSFKLETDDDILIQKVSIRGPFQCRHFKVLSNIDQLTFEETIHKPEHRDEF